MKGIVTIYKDDNYAVIVTRQNMFLHVQFVSYIPQQLMNADNILEEHLSANVIETKSIATIIDGKVNEKIKIELNEAISYFQKKLALFNQAEEYIAGALKDYEQDVSR